MSNLLVTITDSVAKIVLNRPKFGNRIDMAMVTEMTQLINEFSINQDIKLIHLTGQGDIFSQGRQAPKEDPENKPSPKTAIQIRTEVTDPLLGVYAAMKSCQIPLVSSVYGDAAYQPKVEERIGKPLSPYAVSKQTNELYAEVFSKCYGIRIAGFRYFNVLCCEIR